MPHMAMCGTPPLCMFVVPYKPSMDRGYVYRISKTLGYCVYKKNLLTLENDMRIIIDVLTAHCNVGH